MYGVSQHAGLLPDFLTDPQISDAPWCHIHYILLRVSDTHDYGFTARFWSSEVHLTGPLSDPQTGVQRPMPRSKGCGGPFSFVVGLPFCLPFGGPCVSISGMPCLFVICSFHNCGPLDFYRAAICSSSQGVDCGDARAHISNLQAKIVTKEAQKTGPKNGLGNRTFSIRGIRKGDRKAVR